MFVRLRMRCELLILARGVSAGFEVDRRFAR